MDVSFSIPSWKINEIRNIDMDFQEQFYASTDYNLNDFKSKSKANQPIFKIIDEQLQNVSKQTIKQLLKTQNISIAIFITYVYNLLSLIEKPQTKIINQPDLKLKQDIQTVLESQRKFIQPQNVNDIDVMKQLKIKIYQIDLCQVNNVPQRLNKYYNNNLLKKIIFQYLTKVNKNISLLQILLQDNQLLCFAITLISKSLLFSYNLIQSFDETVQFHSQISIFIKYFDNYIFQKTLTLNSIQHRQTEPNIKSVNILDRLQQPKSFHIKIDEMRSKSVLLQQKINQNKRKYFLYLVKQQKPKEMIKIEGEIIKIQGLKKISSTKQVNNSKSHKSIKTLTKLIPKKQKKCLDYFPCLRYMISQSQKS